jgi:4-aminobutyrate aminotransferase-like enzyme
MDIASTIALLVTGAFGCLGWFFAWHGRGEQLDAMQEEEASKQSAADAGARAVTAEARLAAEQLRGDSLQRQLDSERAAKQSIIDAVAKSGAPVAPVIVDDALGRLYQNGSGQGPGADASGNPVGVSGQPAPATAATSKS